MTDHIHFFVSSHTMLSSPLSYCSMVKCLALVKIAVDHGSERRAENRQIPLEGSVGRQVAKHQISVQQTWPCQPLA